MAAALALAATALAVTAPSARAAKIAGVVPDQPYGLHTARAASVFGAASLDYREGPVMHSNRTHVIFWNPWNDALTWDAGYKAAIINFLTNVAADSHTSTNVYALTPQYTDATGRAFYDSTFAGAIDDSDVAPPTNDCTLPPTGPTLPDGTTQWPICLQKTDLETEISSVIAANHLPTGGGDIYVLVTPDGFGSCDGAGPTDCSLGGSAASGYCGFHSYIGAQGTTTIPSQTVLYADIPYNHVATHCHTGGPNPNGTSDESISSLSHEQNETITDPTINAWINADMSEDGDLCATTFGPPLGGSSGATAYNQVIGSGHYYIQAEWSNEDAGASADPNVGCKASDEADALGFAVPPSITPGSTLTLNGIASDPDGFITSYSWSFGDGSPPASGASVSHPLATTGVYQVTLSTTDVGGQQQSLTHQLVVDRPPVAAFSVATAHPTALLAVRFNGAPSSDPDGSITSYRWSFGDGSAAAIGVAPSHAFDSAGSYRVGLTVTDNLGVFSSTTRTVTVVPFPSLKPTFRSGALRITVNGPGTITIAGRRTVVRRAGTVRLKIPLTAAQRRRLHKAHVLRLKLTIVFAARTGVVIARTITVTLHG